MIVRYGRTRLAVRDSLAFVAIARGVLIELRTTAPRQPAPGPRPGEARLLKGFPAIASRAS